VLIGLKNNPQELRIILENNLKKNALDIKMSVLDANHGRCGMVRWLNLGVWFVYCQ